jgi:replicative DNA helicase
MNAVRKAAPPSSHDDQPASGYAPLPPHDLDAEAAVLSAVLLATTPHGSEPGALDAARHVLTDADFFSGRHRWIFGACCALADAGSAVDVVLVAGWLRDQGRFAQVGGMAYLTDVINAAPAVRHVASYASVVARHARTRRLIARYERAALELRAGADADAVVAKVREVEAIADDGGSLESGDRS